VVPCLLHGDRVQQIVAICQSLWQIATRAGDDDGGARGVTDVFDATAFEDMTPAERQAFLEQAERDMVLSSTAMFATTHSHGNWLPYRHLVHTSDAIVGMIERDECDMLVIEEPVRHGKTELCSRWTPAWFITKYHKRVLLASYEADFAATHGRRTRDIVEEVGPEYGVHIKSDSKAAARWELVGADGGMNTAGAGGPITGKGGHLCIVDDPIKNSEDAYSPVLREKLWEWWQWTFVTRREPGVKYLVVMSRWNEDDLVGRLLKHAGDTGMRIRRVRLPAIAEDDDELGRTPGQALCPERFDEVALAGIRHDVGPGPWASLYQQRPVALGGGIFRRDSIRTFRTIQRDDGTWYDLGGHLVDDALCWRFSMLDPAFTRTARSDYTVAGTFAVAPGGHDADGNELAPKLLLLDVRRVRTEHAEHAPLVKAVWDQYGPAWVGIEKQMATLSLFDQAQRQGVVVRWLKPDKNKIARAETAVALCDAGRVYVAEGAAWVPDFLDELASFPAAAHDDQVDVLAYACAELARNAVAPRRPKRQEPSSAAERCWAQLERRSRKHRHHPTLGRMP
jgi:predicted phage terminase large subunit-like protein